MTDADFIGSDPTCDYGLLGPVHAASDLRHRSNSSLPPALATNCIRRERDSSDEIGWRRQRIEAALRFLETHYSEPLSIARIAGTVRMSETHFNRMFRKITGDSPFSYLRRLRINKACAMLKNPSVTVKEVAYATGFRNPYHFSRVFHEVMEITPTDYRNRLYDRFVQ